MNNFKTTNKTFLSERRSNPQNDILLIYKLFEEQISEKDFGKFLMYSMLITCETAKDNEEILLQDIARDKSKALEMFDIFASNDVDPCSAPYIMDELLSQNEFL